MDFYGFEKTLVGSIEGISYDAVRKTFLVTVEWSYVEVVKYITYYMILRILKSSWKSSEFNLMVSFYYTLAFF